MANYRMNKLQIGSNTYECAEWFGDCATAASTATKSVTISGFTSEQLVNGCKVTIHFVYAQEADAFVYLKIGNTTSSPIYYGHGDYADKGAWKAGAIVTFTRYSNAWHMDRRDYLTLADLPVWDGSVT